MRQSDFTLLQNSLSNIFMKTSSKQEKKRSQKGGKISGRARIGLRGEGDREAGGRGLLLWLSEAEQGRASCSEHV